MLLGKKFVEQLAILYIADGYDVRRFLVDIVAPSIDVAVPVLVD